MTPATAALTPLTAAGACCLGEGPVWDARLSRLYWVDIVNGRLHWLDVDSDPNEQRTCQLPAPIGFVALTDDPQIVVVGLSATLAFLDLGSSRVEVFARLESSDAPLRCNDGKCDPAGRLWVGTIFHGSGENSPGSLYSVKRDGHVRRRLSGLGCSNGLAWNAPRNAFYFIDSLARRVDRHECDLGHDRLGNAFILVSFSQAAGLPDGMCIDAEGHLWVAFWDGGCVRRIHGKTGEILTILDLPVSRVTSCTFGGADLGTLFITTAFEGLTAEPRAAEPLAGSVFTTRPGVRGTSTDRFCPALR